MAIAAFTIVLGIWITTEISHKRANDRAKQALRRDRAAEAKEQRELRQEKASEHKEKASEAVDTAVEDANRELLRAAKAGQRDAVARAEAKLTQLTRRQDASDKSTDRPPKDPVERELDRFPVKRPPLFAQQISSNGDDHVLFVAVARPLFCLKSPAARLRVVRTGYLPINHRLRSAGIKDFELVVTPRSNQAPARSDALAIGVAGKVSLTNRGNAC